MTVLAYLSPPQTSTMMERSVTAPSVLLVGFLSPYPALSSGAQAIQTRTGQLPLVQSGVGEVAILGLGADNIPLPFTFSESLLL